MMIQVTRRSFWGSTLGMRIGSRYITSCEPLLLAGDKLKFVTSVKYLGICIKAFIYFKCMVDHVKLKFYRF